MNPGPPETTPSTRPVRPRVLGWIVRSVFVLGVIGLSVWLVRKWSAGPSDLDRGRAALQSDDPVAARTFLDQFLETHPSSAEAHFRAAQSARQCGDAAAAARYLDRAADLDWDPAAIDVQRALLRVQAGESESDEAFLLRHIEEDDPDAPEILATLVGVYARQFRWPHAERLTARWVHIRPNSARAWARRGEALERLRRRGEAVAALREAVRLDANDRRTRLDLVRLLLETRQPPAEAAEHLTVLSAADPDDPAVVVQLAICRMAQGNAADAAAQLDRAIALGTTDPKAFQLRGRIELDGGRPATAITFLQRSADLDPSDPQTLYALLQAHQRAGHPAQAAAVEARWKQAEADLTRAGELAAAIAKAPHDPDLRRQMGELFLRNGRDKDGLRWLESALRERPDHGPTHQTLAAYYERTGRPDLAAEHRSAATLPGLQK
jgi:predicted Zn-dependent protease